MNQLAEKQITCPYCGETIDILIDSLERDQSYIEDCQVCCRPIEMKIFVDGAGQISVQVSHEDE